MAAVGRLDFSCVNFKSKYELFKHFILELFYSRFSICYFPLMDIKNSMAGVLAFRQVLVLIKFIRNVFFSFFKTFLSVLSVL